MFWAVEGVGGSTRFSLKQSPHTARLATYWTGRHETDFVLLENLENRLGTEPFIQKHAPFAKFERCQAF